MDTRISADQVRLAKKWYELTEVCTRTLNTPGPGTRPSFAANPHITAPWYGADWTHAVDIESVLHGHMNYDPVSNHAFPCALPALAAPVYYPTSDELGARETRLDDPAFLYRNPYTPLSTYEIVGKINPQAYPQHYMLPPNQFNQQSRMYARVPAGSIAHN